MAFISGLGLWLTFVSPPTASLLHLVRKWTTVHSHLTLYLSGTITPETRELILQFQTWESQERTLIGSAGGFPGSSAGWEVPLEKGYPLQYSWASLVVQTIKNPLAMQET